MFNKVSPFFSLDYGLNLFSHLVLGWSNVILKHDTPYIFSYF
jgi:hypothetical protein